MTIKQATTILLLLFSKSIFGQEVIPSTKKFDLLIYEYLNKSIDKDSTSLEAYLIYTKPFSKWDIRPIEKVKVWALDTIQSSSQIPNFIWGAFSNKFNFSEKDAMNKPNEFLSNCVSEEEKSKVFFNKNHNLFDSLVDLVLKQSNQIFLNQNILKRVDNLYLENGRYWRYIIDKESPFPISDKTEILKKTSFNSSQEMVLNKMSELQIYSLFKTKNGIFLLLDGFTDNSYGFYYSENQKLEDNNPLFKIMKFSRINENYYFYIAN